LRLLFLSGLHDPKILVTLGFFPTLPFGFLNNFFNLPNLRKFGSLLQESAQHSEQQSEQQSVQQSEQHEVQSHVVQHVVQSELHGVQSEGVQHEGAQHDVHGVQQVLQLKSQVEQHKPQVTSQESSHDSEHKALVHP